MSPGMTLFEPGGRGPFAINFHLYKPCNYRCRFCFATFRDIQGRLAFEQDMSCLVRELRPERWKVRHTDSAPILEVGVAVALAQTRFSPLRLIARGGRYDW